MMCWHTVPASRLLKPSDLCRAWIQVCVCGAVYEDRVQGGCQRGVVNKVSDPGSPPQAPPKHDAADPLCSDSAPPRAATVTARAESSGTALPKGVRFLYCSPGFVNASF